MKTTQFNAKKILSGMLVAGTLLTTSMNTITSVANAESIDKAPKAEEVSSKTEISDKYSFIARHNAQTKLETFGSGWHKTTKNTFADMDAMTVLNPKDSQKGKMGVIYKNVGKYKGKNVNLKITVLDWDPYFTGNKMISFGLNSISHQQTGYNSVKQKWDYIDDSGKAIDMSGTYMTFNDLDSCQSIQFDTNTSKNVAEILYNKGSILQYFNHNGQIEIKAKDNELYENDDKRTMFTALFNGSSMTFEWKRDFKEAGVSKDTKTPDNYGGSEFFGYLGKKLAPTEMIAPTKKVSDKNEKNKDSNTIDTIQEAYDYSIYQEIPDEWKEYYYKSATIGDDLIPELELVKDKKIKVVDEGKKDRTSFFTNNTKGNAIQLDATKEALNNPEFYGHTYELQLPVRVKEGASLDKYKDKDGNIILPNTGYVKINGDKKSTNKVTTKLTPIKQEIQKMIIDDGKAVDSDTLSEEDPVVTYRVDNVVPNDKVLKSLVLTDDVDKHLELLKDSVKVISSDATANQVKVEENKEDSESTVDTTDSSSVQTSSEQVKNSSNETSTATTEKAKSSNIESALKSAQAIADKYKDAKSGTTEHVVKNNAEMVVDALESMKQGSNVSIDKNIEIIDGALNPNSEANKPTGENKEALETLRSILESVKGESSTDTSSADSSKDNEQDSTVNKGTTETVTDEAEAGKVDDSAIQEDAKEEMTGEATPKGDDVTKKGKLDIQGNKITWTANDPKEFSGKKLTIVFQAKLKDGVKLSDLKDGKIPNTAVMTVNGKEYKSNTVYVDVTPEKQKVTPPEKSSEPKSSESSSESTTPETSTTESIEGEAKPKELPKEPTPEKPSFLPQTGTDAMKEIGIGITSLGIGGLLGFLFGRKKK